MQREKMEIKEGKLKPNFVIFLNNNNNKIVKEYSILRKFRYSFYIKQLTDFYLS